MPMCARPAALPTERVRARCMRNSIMPPSLTSGTYHARHSIFQKITTSSLLCWAYLPQRGSAQGTVIVTLVRLAATLALPL